MLDFKTVEVKLIKRVFLSYLLGIFLFCISTVEASKLYPESHVVLSDSEYAEYIKTRCYLPSTAFFSDISESKNFPVLMDQTDQIENGDGFKIYKPYEEIELESIAYFIPLQETIKTLLSIPQEEVLKATHNLIRRYVHRPLEDQLILVNQLGNPLLLPLLINSLLDDSQALTQIVKKSYYHHNGFDKFVLLEDENFTLRLHIWWEGNDMSFQENVHNHRWDFVSSVLTGTLIQDFFEIIETNAIKSDTIPADCILAHHYLYTPYKENLEKRSIFSQSQSDRYKMQHLGYSILKHQLHIRMPRSFSYSLRRQEHHRVISDYKETVATLMLYTKPYGDSSEVYPILDKGFFSPETDQLVKVQIMSREQVTKRLQDFLSYLSTEDPKYLESSSP